MCKDVFIMKRKLKEIDIHKLEIGSFTCLRFSFILIVITIRLFPLKSYTLVK